MIILKKKLIFSVGEVWFEEEPKKINDVDILYYWHRTYPIDGAETDEVYTRTIDLTKSHDELWQSISSNDRYKIRRAEQKDEVLYQFWEKINYEIINQFSDFYELFAVQKGLINIDRNWLKQRADIGLIDISRVKTKDDNPLVWHLYYRTKDRVRLLHSASIKNSNDSSYQSFLGRANRYHHWQDIVRFKNSGIKIYDFGGWYTGNTDRAKLGINEFKEKFGGEVVKNFNCIHTITVKGKLYLYLVKIYASLRQLPLLRISLISLVSQTV